MASELKLLVLGATGGIGTAVVELAVQLGHSVIALGRTQKRLQTLKGVIAHITFDALDMLSIERAFRSISDIGFSPSAAVNCFGITRRNPFLSQQVSQWDEVTNINLRGTWRCMQLEAKAMTESNGGSIVNVASVAGFRGNSWGEAPYIASKHGVIGLTRAAALELGQFNIRVNSVCPSVVETSLAQEVGFSGESLVRLAHKHPIGRLVTVKEIAHTVLWLCSEMSSGVTGIVMPIDGGITAG